MDKINVVNNDNDDDLLDDENKEVEIVIDNDDELEDLDEDLEKVEVKTTSSKKGFDFSYISPKRLIIIVMLILLLLLFLFLFFSFIISGVNKSSTSYSYENIEDIMKNAAIAYFAEHPTSLPKNDGNIVEVDCANLVAEGKMKDLSSYVSKGVLCTGSVKVEKYGTNYSYIPVLNCGDSYSKVNLYTKVINDNKIVSSGYGLYSINGNYVFRGEIVNNYVMLDNSLWRIVKITSNNSLVLVNDNGIRPSDTWDDRFNQEKGYDVGINQYSISRIRELLNNIYQTAQDYSAKDDTYYKSVISNSDKANLVSYNLCVGKVDGVNDAELSRLECADTVANQRIGVLTLSEYLLASIDPNCKNAESLSCKNYNYLVTDYNWWLATAYKNNTYEVYMVDDGGTITHANASSMAVVRPVIYLSNSTPFKSGEGTLENPYKIK